MILLKDYILAEELKDDIISNGLLTKYDDNNPYMFVKIKDCSESIESKLNLYGNINELVLLIKRVAKLCLGEQYIISFEDTIAIFTLEEYQNYIKGEN